MGILKNLKRRFGMAKRFRRERKIDMEKGTIDDEYKVEEIAERVAEEEIEEMVEDGPMTKEEFLISKGMQDRPNSIMALTAWEEYNAS